MFNLNKLDIIKGDQRDTCKYSFVGIERNSDNRLEFWLPLNFSDFPSNDKDYVRKFFFRMYKTMRVFTERNKRSSNYSTNDRDGVIQANGGLRISYADQDDIICYGKITMLEAILLSFDEMSIASIIRKNVNYGDIKYEKIERHLEKSIFSYEDHSFYINDNISERNVVGMNASTIVEMFCFIYTEIKKELQEEKEVQNEIIHLSLSFKEKHLTSTSSLFGESFESTIVVLKQTLDDICRTTSYKDQDFWVLFDAVEKFLYGEFFPDDNTGEFWGINNFWAIWEDMCQYYLFSTEKENIAYADSSLYGQEPVNGSKKIYLNRNILPTNIFYLEYQDQRRYLFPDAVLFENSLGNQCTDNSFENVVYINTRSNYTDTFHSLKSIQKKANDEIIQVTIKATKHPNSIYWTSKIIDELNHHTKRKQTGYSAKFDQFSKKNFEKIKEYISLEYKKSQLDKNRQIKIIDFKNSSISHYQLPIDNEKISRDIKKQHVYELALRIWHKHTDNQFIYEHQFIIPYFTKEENSYIKLSKPQALNKTNINLVGGNFQKIQECYINWDSQ